MFTSTGMATTGVADIGNDITEPDTTFPKLPHCLLTNRDVMSINCIFQGFHGKCALDNVSCNADGSRGFAVMERYNFTPLGRYR